MKSTLFSAMKTLTRPFIGTGIGRIPGAKRLYARIGGALIPESERVVDMGWAKIEVNVEGRGLDGMAAALVFEKQYEPLTTEIAKRIVKPGMNAVDVGANIGYYTLLLAGLVGKEGVVQSIEPQADNYRMLTRNVGRNKADNVLATCTALSDRDGRAELYESKTESGEHSLVNGRVTTTNRTVTIVDVTTLDKILRDGRVDFIKIDVEGNEQRVIEGGMETLKRNKDVKIVMEFWPEGLRKAADSGAPARLWWTMKYDLGFAFPYTVDEIAKETVKGDFDDVLLRCEGGRKQSVNVLWSRTNLDEVILC